MQSNNDEQWVMAIEPGLRFLGKIVRRDYDAGVVSFELNPAFEYMAQTVLKVGCPPDRKEMVMPVDMIGDVPVHVRPMAYFFLHDLPEWRRKELRALVESSMKETEPLRVKSRSGLVVTS